MNAPPTPDTFDRAAASYDETFEALPGTARVRRIVHTLLLRHFHPGDTILELNAGTGTDAVHLASRGIRVHATDASPAMIREMQRKVNAHGFGNLVTTQLLAFDGVASLKGHLYDGVLSDMGGLNCLQDMVPLLQTLKDLVRPGGYLVLCFMPDCSLWDTFAFGLRGDWRNARRRRNPNGCLASVEGAAVRTYYHSPRKVVRACLPGLVHVSTTGLNFFTPPPSSVGAYTKLRPVLPLLERLEDLFAPYPPFNAMGDHTVVVLRRAQ